jgi:omega-amidase
MKLQSNNLVPMKIALIQTSLMWENPTQNQARFEQKINSIAQSVDLIILPEMFSTGFSMHPEPIAEAMQGETVQWMQGLASKKNCAIMGSIIIAENNKFFNRLVFVFPSGEIRTYDKRHLFSLAGENKIYTSGTERLIVEYQGFSICPLICYDLRFPVFSRNTEEYDLLVYVANWPKPRTAAWDILLKARAVENMCFAIGVNRVGFDENGYEYSGHSQAIDFMGNSILEPQQNEGVFIIRLDKDNLIEARNKFGFLNDRDLFKITNR